MTDYDNQATVRVVRLVKAQALREAADAIESVWEGVQNFTPKAAACALRARAAELETMP